MRSIITLPAKIVTRVENFPGSDEPFIIKDNFVERFNPRIGYVGKNVKNNFYPLIIPPVRELSIQGFILGETVSGDELVRGFGRSDALSFVVAWHLIKKQPFGESGFLLTNGSTNVFLDCGFSIGIFWWMNGWSIRAYPAGVISPRPWFEGNQVVLIH